MKNKRHRNPKEDDEDRDVGIKYALLIDTPYRTMVTPPDRMWPKDISYNRKHNVYFCVIVNMATYSLQWELAIGTDDFDVAAGESVEPAAFAGVLRVGIGMHEGVMVGEWISNPNFSFEGRTSSTVNGIYDEVADIPFLYTENSSAESSSPPSNDGKDVQATSSSLLETRDTHTPDDASLAETEILQQNLAEEQRALQEEINVLRYVAKGVLPDSPNEGRSRSNGQHSPALLLGPTIASGARFPPRTRIPGKDYEDRSALLSKAGASLNMKTSLEQLASEFKSSTAKKWATPVTDVLATTTPPGPIKQ
ncbi:hypothetical protein BDZ89DRAFT_1186484 [Hymenopellis radicata]|nr:hypothetical protein BDZ89DRAFT_1186484 [Hymenopellis radicata]